MPRAKPALPEHRPPRECVLSPDDCHEINEVLRDIHSLVLDLEQAKRAKIPIDTRLETVVMVREQLEAIKKEFFPEHP